jgi:hypothetical protein
MGLAGPAAIFNDNGEGSLMAASAVASLWRDKGVMAL